jgi:bifunctional UDP-N-acetylglucosamine pyrophosphorylase/glucosamine-1-phosphate N-acetyltransferase
VIGRDAEIEPNVVFGPGVTVETGARSGPFQPSRRLPCQRARGGRALCAAAPRRGDRPRTPHRQFRRGQERGSGEGAKVNHLTYIGDAEVGAHANIGAGTVTCNYDGVFKHRTEIGEDAFIGSDTMLVAPVTVGDGAMTASGSVITEDVPGRGAGLGRARQENKAGLRERLMDEAAGRQRPPGGKAG